MCLISLSSEQHDLYISRYIYKYTYGPTVPDGLLIWWASDRIMVYHLHGVGCCYCFAFKLLIYLSGFHLQLSHLSMLIDRCNLLMQAVERFECLDVFCGVITWWQLFSWWICETCQDAQQRHKREGNVLFWKKAGKTLNVTGFWSILHTCRSLKNKHL